MIKPPKKPEIPRFAKSGEAKGFVCKCNKYHAFDIYALAHQRNELVFTCPHCGREVIIRNLRVVRISKDRKKP